MNGVVILNEIEAVVGYTWGFNLCGILLSILGLVCLGISLYYGNKAEDKTMKIFFIIALSLF